MTFRCRVCGGEKPSDQFAPSRLRKADYICRPCNRAKTDEWKSANREKLLSTAAAWRDANREGQRSYDRARYWSDPEAHRARVVGYRSTGAGRRKRALWEQARRARALGTENTLTDEEWVALVDVCGGKCLACGRDDVPLTRDHIKPLALGGSLALENAQPLCRSCNSSKKKNTIDYRPDAVQSWVNELTGVTPAA